MPVHSIVFAAHFLCGVSLKIIPHLKKCVNSITNFSDYYCNIPIEVFFGRKIKQYRTFSMLYCLNDTSKRAPLKTPSEKKHLCTASAASSPLVVRKHAFDGFSCIYCTYLLFLTQNGFLEVPKINCLSEIFQKFFSYGVIFFVGNSEIHFLIAPNRT